MKAEKCDFEKGSIQFLGFIISLEEVVMDPQKVKAILEWLAPSDKRVVLKICQFFKLLQKIYQELLSHYRTHYPTNPPAF